MSVLTTDANFFIRQVTSWFFGKLWNSDSKERKRERKRRGGRKEQTREERGTVYSYYGKRSSLGMAIRKYNKSKVIKEDYQLLEIKVGLFIIPGERAAAE